MLFQVVIRPGSFGMLGKYASQAKLLFSNILVSLKTSPFWTGEVCSCRSHDLLRYFDRLKLAEDEISWKGQRQLANTLSGKKSNVSLLVVFLLCYLFAKFFEPQVHRVYLNDPRVESLDFGCFHVPRGALTAEIGEP